MRSVSRAAIVVAATFLAASSLAAQTSVSVAVGAAVPMGDLADAVDMGYNATVGLGIKPPLAPLGLRVEGFFNSFAFKGPIDASLRVMGVTVNGTYTMMPQLYLIGGAGMYNAKASTSGSSSNTDVGINFGAGFNIPLTGFGTYIEARYHHVMSDPSSTQFIPVTVGIKF